MTGSAAELKHLLATGGEVVPAPNTPAKQSRGRKKAATGDDEGSTLE